MNEPCGLFHGVPRASITITEALLSEKPYEASPEDKADLKVAMNMLYGIWARNSRNKTVKKMLEWLEAEMTYRVDPAKRLILLPKRRRQ